MLKFPKRQTRRIYKGVREFNVSVSSAIYRSSPFPSGILREFINKENKSEHSVPCQAEIDTWMGQ